jgi:biopolymer transport protein TolR
MAMAVGGSGGVKAEPNVTPMIDVMLVLLIIFMIVIPAISAGFNAQPPKGVNLKAHPEENDDVVLGIDKDGNYYLNKKPIRPGDLQTALTNIYNARAEDKRLFLKADATLDYSKVVDAIDIAAKAGARFTGLISDQKPGTASSVAGDNPMEKSSGGGKP